MTGDRCPLAAALGRWLAPLALCLAPAAAGAETLVVSRQDCQRLVRHVPAADVAYQPGVDVQGRPVAPADLGGGLDLGLPESYSFDVEIQPLAYAARRRIATERAALAAEQAANSAARQQLDVEAAALAERDATIQAELETASALIIELTGGPNETNPATLAMRTARLDALRTNTLAGPDYVDLQEGLARNRQAQALNQGEAASLAQRRAALDAEAADIAARGLEATTMTVGRVTIDVVTGQASFNGRPLQSDEQAALAAKCREVLGQR